MENNFNQLSIEMGRNTSRAIVVWFALALLLSVVLCMAPNPVYDYCTTTAVGVPFPHRIDYCECDGMGGVTHHRPMAFVYNFAIALGISSPIIWLIRGRKKR